MRLTAILATLIALTPNASILMASQPNPPKIHRVNFRLFDAMNFKGQPDLSPYGFEPTHIVYEASLFPAKSTATDAPSGDAIGKVVSAAPDWRGLLIVDVERWIGLPDERERYIDLTQRIKALMPNRQIGYYSVVPVRDYWRAKESSGSAKYAQWQSENDKLQALADKVDVLYPSLYTFYDNQAGWVAYARENLREARRLAHGKPVYAFLWPMYHESNPELRGQFIPADYWRLELETVAQYADGAVFWGGGSKWDPSAPWWKATLAFIESRRGELHTP